MSKFFGVAVLGLFLVGSAAASISIGPVVGYGIGTGKASFFQGTDYEENNQGVQTKDKNLYYSAGQGIKLGLGAEYSIEEISFGLDMGYSMGLEGDLMKSRQYDSFDSIWYTASAKMKTSYIFISPNIKIEKTIMGITPFCGFGLSLAIAPKSTMSEEYSDGTTTGEMVWELSHNLGIGKWGVLGIKYPLIGGLVIVGEIKAEELSFKASHGEITKYTENGVDQLSSMTVREKETDFKDDDTEDTPSNTTKPNIDHTFITAANSVSIRLGIMYSFKIPGAY